MVFEGAPSNSDERLANSGLPVLFRQSALFRSHLLPELVTALLRPIAIGIGSQCRTRPAIGFHPVAWRANSRAIHGSQLVAGQGVFFFGRGL